MSPGMPKKEPARETAVCLYAVVLALLVLAYSVFALAGSWTLWIEWSNVSIRMEIRILDPNLFELRLHSGSDHSKEKMDSQENGLAGWGSGSGICVDLCAAERGRQLHP